PRGVLFWGVYPDPEVTAAEAAHHGREYGLNFLLLLDPSQRLAVQSGVSVVPQAVILNSGGEVLYRGRIDDKYTPDGKRRDDARTKDLERSLEAVLAGNKVPVPETTAFGCPLPRPVK